MVIIIAALVILSTLPFQTAFGQDTIPARAATVDSLPLYSLDAIIATAERSSAPLASSAAAVSRITGEELRRLPIRGLGDALQQVPGLAVLDFEGLGRDPKVAVRGFYGAGEAEYIVVLLDGRPLNGLTGGLMKWDLIPLSIVESIEILRGGASSLYGDAAIGGVVNIITRDPIAQSDLSWSLMGGEHGLWRGSANLLGNLGGRAISVWGEAESSRGFRDHAQKRAGTVGGSLGLIKSTDGSLTFSTLHQFRDFEDPGPLTGESLEISRTRTAPIYRFDHTEERVHRLAVDGRWDSGSAAVWSGYIAGDVRRSDRVRTLPLAPTFADTRNRLLNTERISGSVQVQMEGVLTRSADALVAGVDAGTGRIDTKYHSFLSGDPQTYREARPTRGDLGQSGGGSRTTMAGFVRYEITPIPILRASIGGRLDWLRDSFEAELPVAGEKSTPSHVAFSPKAGLNLRYIQSADQTGNLYVNVSRSFKAPTPDQLFDQRPIPVPFPPYEITFANSELDPQFGTSYEMGLYHRTDLVPERLRGELSLAIYRIDMRDELDFDLKEFRYVNIGRSRHEGVELGMQLHSPAGAEAYFNYTLQSVVSRLGVFEGNYLKAIPRHTFSGGIGIARSNGIATALKGVAMRGIFLDDANSVELSGFLRLDASISYPVRGIRVTAELFNMLDHEYSTTGFTDPAGTGIVYYYPAAGRTLRLGLSTSR